MGFSRQEYWSGLPLPSPNLRLAKKKQKSSWLLDNTSFRSYLYFYGKEGLTFKYWTLKLPIWATMIRKCIFLWVGRHFLPYLLLYSLLLKLFGSLLCSGHWQFPFILHTVTSELLGHLFCWSYLWIVLPIPRLLGFSEYLFQDRELVSKD